MVRTGGTAPGSSKPPTRRPGWRSAGGPANKSTTATRIDDFDSLQAGDLVFIPGADGTTSNPGHVGLYLGDGLILQAPRTGDHVRITAVETWRTTFAFAQRVT